MKSASILAILFLVFVDPPASMARPNQMVGQDWGTKGYKRANMEKRGVWTCSGYIGICMRRGNKASVCQAAGGPMHADRRFRRSARRAVRRTRKAVENEIRRLPSLDLERSIIRPLPIRTGKGWAIKSLLVLERDHRGFEVKMKLEESDKIVKLRLWPWYVCAVLAGPKCIRSMLAKPLDEHCSENAMAKQKAGG